MKIDSELTEKSAKNTQRWWKLTATIDFYLVLGPHMWKKVELAQISLNILAPIPRKDTNPSHPMCPSENLT